MRRKPALLRRGEPATEQGHNDNRQASQLARGWRWEPWWLDAGDEGVAVAVCYRDVERLATWPCIQEMTMELLALAGSLDKVCP